MKPSVLFVSTALVSNPLWVALAAAGIQLSALAIHRLAQIVLQRRSHVTARALVEAMRNHDADLMVTVGKNGELQVLKTIGRAADSSCEMPAMEIKRRAPTCKAIRHHVDEIADDAYQAGDPPSKPSAQPRKRARR